MLPHLVMYNAYMPSFQYKILNKCPISLKKDSYFCNKAISTSCFCNIYDKTPFHIFYEGDPLNVFGRTLFNAFKMV